ncbi:MAG: D-tyrosyl-tRNA(Tyr) deacylase [Acidobacteria bacterium]|nr:D-tyrosyl-tRNA(Tyr) deacylase [Acidobacteriota bacterium]
MKALLQRVSEARVEVEGQVAGAISRGLVVFVGVSRTDDSSDAAYLAGKVVNLRIFPDLAGKMNRSLLESQGALLIVSQFTLCGDCRKGRRPSFDDAAAPEQARTLYERFAEACRASGAHVETGIFQAAMQVHLVNDGPVTILCESPVRR